MTDAYANIPAVTARGLAKLGGPDGEAAFIEACDPRKNLRRSREACCRRWTLSYEEYHVLREHFAHRIAARVMQNRYAGAFSAKALPPGDRE